MTRNTCVATILLFLSCGVTGLWAQEGPPPVAEKDYVAYLFAYFTGNGPGQEQIHFAISADGFNYTALNGNKPVLSSEAVSSTGGLRDPHILRAQDGKTFYMVATDLYVPDMGWNNYAMVLMKSTDLLHWESTVVNIPETYPDEFGRVHRVWAPQTIYDHQTGKYMVYFSMKQGRDPDIIYYVYANEDFTGFEAAPRQLYFPPAESNTRACIDGDIIIKDGKYHLFYKAEDGDPGIKLAISDRLTGGYQLHSPRRMDRSRNPVEGSCIFKLNHRDEWILMYDVYTRGRYQFTKSTDLLNFAVIDDEVSMDFHPRHGTILPITRDELKAVTQEWGMPAGFPAINNNPVLAGYHADPDIIYSHKNQKYYLYPTTDGFTGWSGTYFKTFSSTDLMDWTDEGIILDLKTDVSWTSRNAWAPCCIEKKQGDGYEYYYYFTAAQRIGVAVADDPAGPFKDSGQPLIDEKPPGVRGGQEIDPAVFHDPVSGKDYLYWGNGYMAVVELNEDMVSYKQDSMKVITPDRTFREGTAVFYRQGTYYFLWSEDDTRSPDYRVRYGTSDSPLGPISVPADNLVLAKDPNQGIYGTGHNSVLQIPGRDEWYIVYHRFNYPHGIDMGRAAGYHREVCIDKMEFDEQGAILRTQPTHAGVSLAQASPVRGFALQQVKLLDGPFKHAQDLNLEHLLQYDLDRLMAPFFKEAGLKPKGELFPNWSGLDGHVGGHYLTAMALYHAATGNEECKRRMDLMVEQMAECQAAHGNGYVGGVPNGPAIWAPLAQGNIRPLHRAWVPWYNLHKTFAGLRDAWIHGGNAEARDVLIKLTDWCATIVGGLSDQQMERMLDQEHGGMNEVLVDVYEITGDPKYLALARRFSHRQLLDPMSQGRDTLDNRHANTQVPKAVGFQRIAEMDRDPAYARAARFFWETVVHDRSLAFGGNSRREHFPSAEACGEFVEQREGPESCNTYNMLKLTQGLHRMDPQAAYADYYERALYNHILSTQHPEHGGYVYFTPARPRHYRVYSAPNQGMWCCVGSGMENHGKYGQFIYSRQGDDTLYVNLFIASKLDWQAKSVRLRQETNFPESPQTKLTVLTDVPVHFTLKVRYPGWVRPGALTLKLDDRTWQPEARPSSYVAIERTWNPGDCLEVILPMHTTLEAMPHVPDYVAVLHGPIVLAAKTGTEDLQGLIADDTRWAHIAHGELLPLEEAPMFVGESNSIVDGITPVEGQPLHFKAHALIQPKNYQDLMLEPFYGIHDARYMMYWRTVQPQEYQDILASIKQAQEVKLLMDRRTIDRVIPGEQQPEADHNLQHERSQSGVYRNRSLRHVASPGWFSYDLRVDPSKSLALYVLYWGNERGRRTVDILVDGQRLVTENPVGRWNQDEFVAVQYPLPADRLSGKTKIAVRFNPHRGHTAGGIFDLRILEVE